FAIVGVARTEGDDEQIREDMKRAVQQHGRDELREDVWEALAADMHWVTTDFADEGGEARLAEMLTHLDEERGTQGNRVYYLAVPPPAFPTIVEQIGTRRTAEGCTRLIVETPFGHDLQSAQELHQLLLPEFSGVQISRIHR